MRHRFRLFANPSELHRYFSQPRHFLQLTALLVTLGIGLQFYLHVRQALGPGPVTVSRPPGVEGFLPIGALMGWKHFLLTGQWDAVHPAAMVILGWAIVLSLALRKAFCGWFCPIGTISEWLWKLGRRLTGRTVHVPRWLDMGLRSIKYLLLGFFIWAIGMMGTEQITAFAQSAYFKLADVKMLFFFTRMSALTALVLGVLMLMSLVIKNIWCRYVCPYGALLGLFALASPTRVRRCESSCTQCSRCDRACPSDLPVSRQQSLRSAECSGCMRCVDACPVKGTLTLASSGIPDRFWTAPRIGAFIGLFFIATVYVANLTGHWRGNLSDRQFRVLLQTIDAPENTHPSFPGRSRP